MNLTTPGGSARLAESLSRGVLPKWCSDFTEASPTGRSQDKVRNLLRQLGYRKSLPEDEILLLGCKDPPTHTRCKQLSEKLINIEPSSSPNATVQQLSDITRTVALSLLKTASSTQLSEAASSLITHATQDVMTYVVIPVLATGSVTLPISANGKIMLEKEKDESSAPTAIPAIPKKKEPKVKEKNKIAPVGTLVIKKLKEDDGDVSKEKRCMNAVLAKWVPPEEPPTGFRFGDHFDVLHPKKPSHWNTIMALQGPLIADTKYDGERLIIHRKGDGDYEFFSRNRFKVPLKKVNGLFPVINEALKLFSTCVLDCEIISEYTHGGAVGGIDKSTLVDKPLLFIFDVMYVGGVCIAHVPLRVRKMIIAQLLSPVPDGQIRAGDFTPVSGSATQKRDVLMHQTDRHLRNHMEGIVVKQADSPYLFGNKTLWIKLKRGYLDYTDKLPTIPAQECCKAFKEFMEGERERLFGTKGLPALASENSFLSPPSFKKIGNLPDTIDCAVLGCRFPETGARDLPESLLVGLWDDKKARFCTLCYVPASQLGSSKVERLWERLKQGMLVINRKKTKLPKHIAIHESNLPDTCIASAKRCIVVEIDGERFQESWEHTCDFIAIIKPHIVRVRNDKDIDSLTSKSALIEMYSNSAANKQEMNPNIQCDDIGGKEPSPSQLRLLKPAVARQLSSLSSSPPSPMIRVLAVSISVVGRWSSKGIMKTINTLFGPSTQKKYEQLNKSAKLGDIHFVQVNKSGESEVYVCLMLCQKYTVNNPVIPKVDIPSWEVSVRKLSRFCVQQSKQVEVHLVAAAPPVPNANWDVMKEVIEKFVLSKNIPVVRYMPSDLSV